MKRLARLLTIFILSCLPVAVSAQGIIQRPHKPIPTRQKPNPQRSAYPKGEAAYNKKDYTEALKWFHMAADQGDARAQYYLGKMYAYAQGVVQNYTEAVNWYQKAADQGNAKAQFELGFMYYSGCGVTHSFSEALKWYRKAADQGNANAQFFLGTMYLYGYGVPADLSEAKNWYKKAADHGSIDARKVLKDLR